MTLFQSQISFLSAGQNLRFKKIKKKQLSVQAEHLRNKIYYNYLVTLKLQLFTSIYVKSGRKGLFNEETRCLKN